MKIVCISDTHERHRLIPPVPDGDVLVHAGDFTLTGDIRAIADFNEWLGEQPHRYKVVIPGNHELGWCAAKQAILTNATHFLLDSACEIEGVKFYGSPYTPTFMSWAFMLPRGKTLFEKWRAIPEDTDVLITHGPPVGSCDTTHKGGEPLGDLDLAVVVDALPVKLHIFGHIHGSGGQQHRKNGTTFVNASVLDEAYRPNKKEVFVAELGRK